MSLRRSRVPPWLRTEADDSPSKIVTEIEARLRRVARVQPAGPAPIMAIFGVEGISEAGASTVQNILQGDEIDRRPEILKLIGSPFL